jgi:hypothetical protein
MNEHGKTAPALRYLPALFFLLLAIGLTLRISDDSAVRDDSSVSSAPTSTSGTRPFKSRNRIAITITFPQLRQPVTVASADEIPITPKEASDEMTVIARFDSPSTRGKAAATLIRRLCRSGYPEEAFAAIDSSSPIERETGITAWFLAAEIDDAAIFSRIRQLPHAEDAPIAFVAYSRRVPVDQLRLLLAESGDLSPAFVTSLDGILDLKLKSPSERKKAGELVEELHSEGLASDKILGQKILTEPTLDAFGKWEELGKRLTNSPALVRNSWKYCVDQMIAADPRRTADQIASTTATAPNQYLQYVLIEWSAKDPEAARRWYDERHSTASMSVRDDAALAFMVNARRLGQTAEALVWQEKIGNPQVRKFLSTPPGPPIILREADE